QAEDGIRDLTVTGVQTCALPIYEEDLVPPTLECLAHPLFALALVVLPGIVKEIDAGIDGLVSDGNGLLQRRGRAEAVATDTENRSEERRVGKERRSWMSS